MSAPHPICRSPRCTILLVDDEPLIRRLTARALADEDYDVLEAADGQDALERLRLGATVDIVVSDVMMPRMTGLELVRHVQAEFPGVRMILVSGYESGEHAPVPLLPKPFQFPDLLALITRALESRGTA